MTQTQPFTLAVVIVSWNVAACLDACLSSLRNALRGDEIQATVWVVDNASQDGSADQVRSQHPWVHLEALAENVGFVRANNRALRALQGQARYYWLLNPDTVIPPGTAGGLVRFLDEHPRAGLVSPKLLNPDGSLQECAFRFPGLSQALYSLELMPTRFYYTALNGRYPRDRFDTPDPIAIDHPLGAAMMARGDAVEAVGYLDESLFMYCEEIDWAWRMRKAGWQTYLLPTAEVTHLGGASSRQARPVTTAYLWESRAHLYRKHRDPVTRFLVRWAVLQVFGRRMQRADTPEWAAAYRRILTAWR